MTGLELLKAPGTTAEEVADIVSEHCPPVVPTECDRLACRECWLSWLATGEPPKEAGPSGKQTAPDEEGMHPNLVEMYERHFRRQKQVAKEMRAILTAPHAPPSHGQQQGPDNDR